MLVWILVMKDENDIHLKMCQLHYFPEVCFALLTRRHIEYLNFLNKSLFNDSIGTNKNMLH